MAKNKSTASPDVPTYVWVYLGGMFRKIAVTTPAPK